MYTSRQPSTEGCWAWKSCSLAVTGVACGIEEESAFGAIVWFWAAYVQQSSMSSIKGWRSVERNNIVTVIPKFIKKTKGSFNSFYNVLNAKEICFTLKWERKSLLWLKECKFAFQQLVISLEFLGILDRLAKQLCCTKRKLQPRSLQLC